MKILFVSSGNNFDRISPIIKSQGDSLKSDEVRIEYFTITGGGIFSYIRSVFSLNRFLKKEKFDIIHAHYGFSALVSFFAKRSEKLVVSFMGDDLCGINDFSGKILRLSRFYVMINRLFAKKFYQECIVKSKEMHKILNVSNSIVIPNGVDFKKFYPLRESNQWESDRVKTVLFCANPDRAEKNFKLARKAVDSLSDRSVELKYIYGLAQEQLVHYYNSADCVILSSFHEGSPNVIKEAMACNIPIVSVNVGDVQEVIGGTEGCFLSTYEENDVAKNIRNALSFGKRTTGRQDIQHLDSQLIAKKIINVYKKVLKG